MSKGITTLGEVDISSGPGSYDLWTTYANSPKVEVSGLTGQIKNSSMPPTGDTNEQNLIKL